MHQSPSDISREEYEQIREDLEGARKKTRPREYDLYIVDAQSVQNADTAEEKGYDAGKKYQESSATLS